MTNRRPLTLLVIAALLPLVALSAALGAAALRQQQRAMEREALDQITRISALVSRELTAQLEILQAFAGSPLFDGVPDEAAFTDWSQRLLREHALWRTVSLSDRDGNRLFDVPELIGGIKGGKVVEADSHRRSVETLRPVIGGVRVGSRSKSAFAIRAPVIPSGQVAYVVSAIVFPDAIQDLLFASGLPAAWLGAVLDTDGRLAASTAGPSASIGQPAPQLSELRRRDDGPYQGISFEGENMETLYRADAATGWAVQVGIPDKIFRAPLVRSMWLIASGAAISLALAAAFLWLLSREVQLRRRTAETAEQARRVEALGRITGGVAHEFNNLLTVVVGNLGLAIELAKADPELTRYLDRALRGADRGSRITRQLLATGRRENLNLEALDVAKLIEGMSELLRVSLTSRIKLVLAVTARLSAAMTDAVQLELGLLNLVINARDANSDEITITAAEQEIDIAEANRMTVKPGRYIEIAVRDSGSGMTPMVAARAFEPFFTTKEFGVGSGLGLSHVYGFARQSAGTCTIESHLGEGTTVRLYLPAVSRPAGDLVVSPPRNLPQPRRPANSLLRGATN